MSERKPNKVWLVAQREYVENLRTKTFWLGILSLPVILLLSVLVPVWLEGAKDERHFAIIDRSGWMLEAMKEQSQKDAYLPPFHFVRSAGEPYFELQGRIREHIGEQDPADLPEDVRAALEAQASGREPTPEEVQALVEYQQAQMRKLPEDLRQELAALQTDFEWAMSMAVSMQRMRMEQVVAVLELDAAQRRVIHGVSQAELEGMVAEFLDLETGLAEGQLDQATGLAADERKALVGALNPGEEAGGSLETSRDKLTELPAELSADEQEERARQLLQDGELFAYFVVGENPKSSSDGFLYVSMNRTDTGLKNRITRLATKQVRKRLIADEGISEAVSERLLSGVEFEDKQLGTAGEEEEVKAEDVAKQWAPVGFVYFLWIAVFTIAQMLLTNTIEEKSNRIIEVLLSSVSPYELMSGKIMGIALTGLTIVISWVISMLVILKYAPVLLGISEMPFDLSLLVSDPIYLVSFVVYFLLGYLLYAAILVGFGSVCNSLKEAQNLMQPVIILLLVPLLAMIPIGEDPNGTLARVLSFIPPFTPFVMMNRAAGPPAAWEYVATTILLLASIAIAFYTAARIFRIGILMTGKMPKFTDMLGWIRAPEGALPDTEHADAGEQEGTDPVQGLELAGGGADGGRSAEDVR